MEQQLRASGRVAAAVTALLTVTIVLLGGCSGANPTRPPSSTEAPKASAGNSSLVTGRSSVPTELSAPGIQLPAAAQFSFTIGNKNVDITGRNWDTIVGTSHVTPLVGEMFSSGFNNSEVTRNRFQYLADEISLNYRGTNFEPLTIVESVDDGELVDIAALYNPTTQVRQLQGLTVTISTARTGRTVASQDFYATASSAIMIPGRTIYFARLAFAQFAGIGGSRKGSREFTTNFHYARFVSCHNQVCGAS